MWIADEFTGETSVQPHLTTRPSHYIFVRKKLYYNGHWERVNDAGKLMGSKKPRKLSDSVRSNLAGNFNFRVTLRPYLSMLLLTPTLVQLSSCLSQVFLEAIATL